MLWCRPISILGVQDWCWCRTNSLWQIFRSKSHIIKLQHLFPCRTTHIGENTIPTLGQKYKKIMILWNLQKQHRVVTVLKSLRCYATWALSVVIKLNKQYITRTLFIADGFLYMLANASIKKVVVSPSQCLMQCYMIAIDAPLLRLFFLTCSNLPQTCLLPSLP